MSDEKENPLPNPLKMFGDMYQQTLKETAEQWEDAARNPLFLAAMANNVEQTMQMQKQMQEMIRASLQALNLPTKDDILLLAEKIEQLSSEIAVMNAKLDKSAAEKALKSSNRKSKAKSGKTKS